MRMAELPFNTSWLDALADSRIAIVTSIMLLFTFFGSFDFYILLIIFIYWLFDKELGYRLTLVTVFSYTVNHILKIIFANPRPFSQDGTYVDKWAISESNVEDRLTEFSTPSGHAMDSTAFWYYLYRKVTNKYTLIMMIFMILMIGFSRPYLGVHYVEDVVIGWLVGFLIVIIVLKYEESIAKWWNKYNFKLQGIILLLGTVLAISIASLFYNLDPSTQQFATNGGIFTGIILGARLERERLKFDTSFNNIAQALIRYLVGVILVFATLFGLDIVFGMIAEDDSIIGLVLRYIRYAGLGFVATYGAPFIFYKLKLVKILDIKD